jgi:hypothetical protein
VFVYFIHGGKIRAPAAAQLFMQAAGAPAIEPPPAKPAPAKKQPKKT